MIGLAKIAVSFDARRNKQYWQILKRLYGGNDEAVKSLKELKNPNIYHGTLIENLNPIEQYGIRAGDRGIYGKGIYFGSKDKALEYAEGNDSLLRLKMPSELKGENITYPNPMNIYKTTRNSFQGSDISEDKLRSYQYFGVIPTNRKKKRYLNQDELLFTETIKPELLTRDVR